jgi:hypothetical protein
VKKQNTRTPRSKSASAKKPETIQNELSEFGKKLKEWNGDVDKIGGPLRTVLKSSLSTFKETKDPCYLLLSFVLQSIVSFIVSKSIFNQMLFKAKTEYRFPKETVTQLGDQIIDLAGKINQPAFLPALLSIMTFAYQNDLIQLVPTS